MPAIVTLSERTLDQTGARFDRRRTARVALATCGWVNSVPPSLSTSTTPHPTASIPWLFARPAAATKPNLRATRTTLPSPAFLASPRYQLQGFLTDVAGDGRSIRPPVYWLFRDPATRV